LSSRYRFQASAIGAAGHITIPFQEQIEVQASCALPEIGGYGSAISPAFNHRHILSFAGAHCQVTGSETTKDGQVIYYTLVRSTVEGLNILGMVTADRVAAQIVKIYKVDPKKPGEFQQSFKLMGTRFENLRIAGKPLEVDIAYDVFDKSGTYEALPEAYRTGNKAANGLVSISLVRKGETASGYDGKPLVLEGFGTIKLAELEVGPFTRRINMVEIDLGCPVTGRVMACSIIVDGTDN
jgi:hypothetical protein